MTAKKTFNYTYLKNLFIDFLKGQAVKLALKKILGSAVMGGPKAWIIKFIITELFEEIGEPLVRAGLNQLGYYYDKIDGKVQVKKLENARDNNDADAYNRASDNILS